jgi:hypothetical protein
VYHDRKRAFSRENDRREGVKEKGSSQGEGYRSEQLGPIFLFFPLPFPSFFTCAIFFVLMRKKGTRKRVDEQSEPKKKESKEKGLL